MDFGGGNPVKNPGSVFLSARVGYTFLDDRAGIALSGSYNLNLGEASSMGPQGGGTEKKIMGQASYKF
jgi:hypothetical protein